jgi:5-methylcytosine-specific restriction endonuclease McrA
VNVQQNTLLLNADYSPYKVITWRRAVELLLDDRAELVEGYVDRFVRSVSSSMPWPAVLRLRDFVKPKARMRFNRQNVLARDGYQCAYCGKLPVKRDGRPRLEDLTLDHVVPRAQSRNGTVRCHPSLGKDERISVTCWQNIVSCCVDCNITKADRTPEQAGMKLRWAPRTPTMPDVLRMALRKVSIPDEWTQYLPEGAKAWGGYWTADLDEE